MLLMVGLGLASETDLTLKAVEKLKKCDEVYLEYYTGNAVDLDLDNLNEIIGKETVLLGRDIVESDFLIKQSKKHNVGFIVQGDPFCATTHSEIFLECKKNKIKLEVVHNASIISAVSETGLQIYKFGKVLSIPFWQENFKPTSFLNVIKGNQSVGAHTLCLLDLDVKNKKFMGIKEALERLSLAPEINAKTKLVIVSRLGSSKQKIVYGSVSKLKKLKLEGPNAVIIPGNLHFKEEEVLRCFE